jgi:hypothetical protein
MPRPAARHRRKTFERSTISTSSQSASECSCASGASDDAGIVDEDVDAAERGVRVVHQSIRGVGLREIGGQRDHTNAAGGGEIARGLSVYSMTRMERDVGAGFRERARHRGAQST